VKRSVGTGDGRPDFLLTFVKTSFMSRINLFMLYLAGSLLFGSGSARAQDPAPLPEKEVVVVDLFARNRTVPAVYVEAVR